MENKDGLISVIVPVYNAAMYIEQTIKSVIKQSYNNWELIIVEDGSEDNSVEIINKYKDDQKIILLQHPDGVNLGVSKSRELGIKAAKGEFIAFLDADDVFFPNKLDNQFAIFSKKKDIILVHSKVEILNNSGLNYNNEFVLDRNDKVYEIKEQGSWLEENKICNSTVIVKSKVLKDIQFGLPQLFQYEDWLLWSLIAEKGKFYYQNEPQIKYRIHPTSATTAILKNVLIAPYSKIEYLISLYLLNNSNNLNKKIAKQLKDTVVKLFEIYSDKDRSKINSFRQDFNNIQGDGKLYYRKYNELLDINSKLQKELEELQKIKKPNSFKLIRKLKYMLNLKIL